MPIMWRYVTCVTAAAIYFILLKTINSDLIVWILCISLFDAQTVWCPWNGWLVGRYYNTFSVLFFLPSVSFTSIFCYSWEPVYWSEYGHFIITINSFVYHDNLRSKEFCNWKKSLHKYELDVANQYLFNLLRTTVDLLLIWKRIKEIMKMSGWFGLRDSKMNAQTIEIEYLQSKF